MEFKLHPPQEMMSIIFLIINIAEKNAISINIGHCVNITLSFNFN